MKRLFFTTCLLLAFVAALAQNATIKGTLKGFDISKLRISYGKTTDTLAVASGGTFLYNPEITTPKTKVTVLDVIKLPGSTIELEMNPGNVSEFTVTNNPSGSPTVTFTGDNAALNTYLTACNVLPNPNNWALEQCVKHPFATHAANVDKMLNELGALAANVNEPARTAKDLEMLNLYGDLLKFSYTWGLKLYRNLPVDADADFNTFTRTIDMNDRRVLHEEYGGYTYTSLIEQRLRWNEASKPDLYQGENGAIKRFKNISASIKDPDVAGHIADKAMTQYFLFGADGYLSETFAAYKQLNKDPETLNKFEKKYTEFMALGAGKLAPDFTIFDSDGKKLLFSDLRGKVLYVDVWASWCGPCAKEMPAFATLYEKYKDNPNIEFIGLSVDDNNNAWKQKLEKEQPAWRNFIQEGGFKNGAMNTKYNITGIPRFLLIDKEGRIISINAPRPSDPKIELMLIKYL